MHVRLPHPPDITIILCYHGNIKNIIIIMVSPETPRLSDTDQNSTIMDHVDNYWANRNARLI